MECARCRHESPAGAKFCAECGAPMALDCARCRTRLPPQAKFCPECAHPVGTPAPAAETRFVSPADYTPKHIAEKILGSRGALQGERKQVTVLFADLVDSMRLADILGAEGWHRVLDRIFEILTRAVHRFEGTINQFTGDGVMALFGAPLAHEDHARRACHAALFAMEELRTYASTLRVRGLDLSVRMGLNSGEVVVGKIGDDLRMDYTAQGHCVGLAARMEQLAGPRTVLLTEHTARLVEGFFTLTDLGPQVVKGAEGAVQVFELRGVGAVRTRLDASALRGLSRLIGRDAELLWLDGILARAIEGSGQVIGVVGDAGLGKSRLCLEFIARCRTRGIAVYEVHCPAHGATVPWLAMRDLLRSCFGLAGDEGVETIRESVRYQLEALDGDVRDAPALVLELLGVTDGSALDRAPESLNARLAAFLRRFIRLRTAKELVLLVLDDAHWIDRASDELVREIVASVRDTRTLFLANFRPDYRPAWIGGSNYHQLALAPLGEADSRELLRELLGSDRSLAELSERIRARTGGNPYFTEEVVQALVVSGSLVGERGDYYLGAPIESLALPETVQSLLAARLDRLGESAKHVLQAAAVMGVQFDEPLLGEVCGLDARDLGAALDELQDGEFVRLLTAAPTAEYAFKHPLMRDVAYRSQLDERRARLHGAVARALERLRADRLGEHAALIAHHWEASGMRFEAARWKRRAALRVANIKLGGRARRPPP